MNSEKESRRKLLEALCVEINHAIISSQEVRSCIQTVKDLDHLDQVEGCNLALELQVVLAIAQDNNK